MKTERLPLFLQTPLECPNKSDDPAHDHPSESDVEHEDDRLLWMPVPLSDDAGCKIYKDDRKLRYEPTTKGESGLDPVVDCTQTNSIAICMEFVPEMLREPNGTNRPRMD